MRYTWVLRTKDFLFLLVISPSFSRNKVVPLVDFVVSVSEKSEISKLEVWAWVGWGLDEIMLSNVLVNVFWGENHRKGLLTSTWPLSPLLAPSKSEEWPLGDWRYFRSPSLHVGVWCSERLWLLRPFAWERQYYRLRRSFQIMVFGLQHAPVMMMVFFECVVATMMPEFVVVVLVVVCIFVTRIVVVGCIVVVVGRRWCGTRLDLRKQQALLESQVGGSYLRRRALGKMSSCSSCRVVVKNIKKSIVICCLSKASAE